uniref:ATP-dependent (S)-NAD(P)H-hydrate dehydratase n=1 Tax=Ditylum brightwellii TaxID=49249 RepID=A0A7S4R5I8_9STRA
MTSIPPSHTHTHTHTHTSSKGTDLAFVFCAEEAAIPIKCYSPELMVAPVYNAAEFEKEGQNEENASSSSSSSHVSTTTTTTKLIENMVSKVTSLFDRMHVLIIGPGLGRDPIVLRAVAQIIIRAREVNLPLILDADALYLLTLEPYRHILQSSKNNDGVVVLTPNVMEYRRLEQAFENEDELKKALDGVIVIQKGHHDTVTAATTTARESSMMMICEEIGGLKRSGGIGDVLAGTLGAFVAWNQILASKNKGGSSHDWMVASCWSACCAVKKATRIAFEKKKRAMTAPDILEEIGTVLDDMASDVDSKL